eukprot:3843386-Pyramimonas_sp.AAC.1
METVMEDSADIQHFKEELECIEDFDHMKKMFDLGERLRDHAVPGSYGPFLVKLGGSMRVISTNRAAPGGSFTAKVQDLLHRANSVIPSVVNWADMSNAIEKREKEHSVKDQVRAFIKSVSELQSSVGESASVDIPLVTQMFSQVQGLSTTDQATRAAVRAAAEKAFDAIVALSIKDVTDKTLGIAIPLLELLL